MLTKRRFDLATFHASVLAIINDKNHRLNKRLINAPLHRGFRRMNLRLDYLYRLLLTPHYSRVANSPITIVSTYLAILYGDMAPPRNHDKSPAFFRKEMVLNEAPRIIRDTNVRFSEFMVCGDVAGTLLTVDSLSDKRSIGYGGLFELCGAKDLFTVSRIGDIAHRVEILAEYCVLLGANRPLSQRTANAAKDKYIGDLYEAWHGPSSWKRLMLNDMDISSIEESVREIELVDIKSKLR